MEGNTGSCGQQGRLSLDVKVSQSNAAKVVTPVNQKKPQRRSLPPRLYSERTSPSITKTACTPSKAINDRKTSLPGVTNKDNTALSSANGEEKTEIGAADEENSTLSSQTGESPPDINDPNAVLDEPSEAVSHVNGDRVVEEQPQLAPVQGPIAAED